jgi:DNA repair protein RecO
MSHHIYKTEAIILRGLPDGEANKYLNVFTRELGLVGAVARSVREGKSKLRYGLQDYSISLVSLVRGKDVWRVINTVPISNIYFDLHSKPENLSAAMRALSLLKKLVAGEERHPELYDIAITGMNFLADASISREELSAFQLVFTLRALSLLGYAVAEPHLLAATEGNEWNQTVNEFIPFINEARKAMQKSLQVTQLYQ